MERLSEAVEAVEGMREEMRSRWLQDLNHRTTVIIVLVLLPLLWFYFGVWRAPAAFPVGDILTIDPGMSVQEIGTRLAEEDVIRSAWWFSGFVRMLGEDRGVIAGDYQFKQPANIWIVAQRLIAGNFGLEPIRVRIPEGSMVVDMADILEERLPRFDREIFIEEATPLEGYLFPDTYFFLPNVQEAVIIDTMFHNFEIHIAEIEDEIAAFGKPLEDVVIMASLLEREEHRFRDRQMIAGVLWTRIEIDMPLQVDAAFLYILGRTTFDLTLEDLNVDSPYNTYRYTGLPAGPIGSPSLSSIRAAVSPIEHDYLFYLADRSGTTHYSETYEEHLRKKRLYLD